MKAVDRQDVVAVHLFSLPVHENDSVSITVQGQSKVSLFFADEPADTLWMKGAAFKVDVLPIRVNSDRDHLSPQFFENSRSHPVGCSIGAIQNDAKSVQCQVIWKRVLKKDD